MSRPRGPSTRTIGATELKEQCLALLDSLPAEGIVITKRGKPVARLIPHHASFADLIGCLRGQLEIRGDILSTGVDWDADAEPGHARSGPRSRR